MSLDFPYGNRTPGVERVVSGGPTPEDLTARRDEILCVRRALGRALGTLSGRERRIIEARAMAEEPVTLASLGQQMGVSKERVRQLEARAHEKLREELADFRPAA